MNTNFFLPSFRLSVVQLFQTSFFAPPEPSPASDSRQPQAQLRDLALPMANTYDAMDIDQPLVAVAAAATERTPTPRYTEPQNMTECPAGQGFDAIAMAEDTFFHDLVCGFTALVLERYRTVTNMRHSLSDDCGMYSVTPTRSAGRAPYPPGNGELDTRTLSLHAGTLTVKPCPHGDADACLRPGSDHRCVDVQAVTRRFMHWFIEFRARVQRVMPPPVEDRIAALFRLHSERCDEEDQRDWDWRRYAVFNLVREMHDPLSCRNGYVRPEDGFPLRRPWAEGDMYIHGVLDWGRRFDDIGMIMYDLRGAMQDAERERKLRRRDPELTTDLWDMAWRDKPDPATLPRRGRASDPTSNPKRDHDKEDEEDWETRPGKMARVRR